MVRRGRCSIENVQEIHGSRKKELNRANCALLYLRMYEGTKKRGVGDLSI